jgi:hypothetical protein
MKTRIVLCALLALALATPAMAHSSVSIGVGFNMPPPLVVYRREPHWVMVPDERVYYVDDDDLGYDYFRYGGWYWIYENDVWYRAHRYNGPFVAVRADYVPGPIWRVGDRDDYRWRHRPAHLPPGLEKKWERGGDVPPGWRNRGDDDDQGHGHGHGHGHGRDHDDER